MEGSDEQAVRTMYWRMPPVDADAVDEVYQTLKEPRRRWAIDYLLQHNPMTSITKGDLARGIASYQYGVDVDEVTATQRTNVLTSLETYHLKWLDTIGIIAVDGNTITRGKNAEAIAWQLYGTRLLAATVLK